MRLMRLLALCVSVLALRAAMAVEAPANPLPNAGFEDGEKMWTIGDDFAKFTSEAAHSGSMGLRLGTTEYAAMGTSAISARLPVTPAQEITVRFWARTTVPISGAFIWFYGADGKLVKDPDIKGGFATCMVNKTDGEWHEYEKTAKAPANAASVAIWLHSFSASKGTADYDDFSVGGIAVGVTPIAPAPRRAAAKPATQPANLPPRQNPPIIILKFDDVKQIKGDIHPHWKRLADFLEQRKIKGSFGIICETLQEATPKYTTWIKEHHDRGYIEFWFHAWDHAVHTEDGKQYNEFVHRSYEEQKKRFDDSQSLAREKLGFPFETFGPPGGVVGASFDANTLRVMADDPYMKAWLYPQPIDAGGKTLDAAGKVTILDRVWAVNTESSVGSPDYAKFVAGYAQNPQREYFVLQGHPMAWAGEKFDEFVRIVDFLQKEKAVFMTPSEFVASRKAKDAK